MANQASLILGGIAVAIGVAAWGLLGGGIPQESTEVELTTRTAASSLPAGGQKDGRLLGRGDRPGLEPHAGRAAVFEPPATSTTDRFPGPGEARISGWVKVAQRPTGGATLTARSLDGTALTSATSRSDGSWALFLKPGIPFVLGASYPMTVPLERTEPALSEGDQRRAGNLTLAMGRRITGTLLDSAGRPVPGAWAAVAGAPATERALASSVQDSGALVLDNTPLGAFIEVGAPGFVTQILRPVTGDFGTTLNAELAPGRKIELRVLDPMGQPIAGANVLFVQAGTETTKSNPHAPKLLGAAPRPDSHSARSSVRTDAAGVATATTFDTGDYWAEVTHPQFGIGTPAAIQAANTQHPAITLNFRPRVQFRVVDKLTGAPVPGATAFCQAEQGAPIPCPPHTGAIDVSTLIEGSHSAFAWAPGYQVGRLELSAQPGPAWDGELDDLPQLALAPAEFRKLTVLDESGRQVPGATLFYRMEPRPERFRLGRASIAADSWELETLSVEEPIQIQAPGDNDWPTLVVRAPDHQTRTITREGWPTPSKSGELTITLYQSTKALIAVVDAQGKPSLGAQIYVTLQGKAMPTPFRTNAKGEALIPGLSPGNASAMARGPAGNLTARVEFELEPGRQTQLTLTLR